MYVVLLHILIGRTVESLKFLSYYPSSRACVIFCLVLVLGILGSQLLVHVTTTAPSRSLILLSYEPIADYL